MEKLKIKNISKAINGLRIVDRVTASFLPGRITGLIGPNGAGKTTLFHIITGELRADTGEINYRGEDITVTSIQGCQKGDRQALSGCKGI